jgi:16S rRNA A1518/A1519 N6-dimethyltransferase RsmA/KsgA/DIM1 with predicted DNA glycosylase/AP lyase activity
MRRKTLVNNITNKYPISREKAIETLKNLGFLETARAEELTVQELINIYKMLFLE